MKWILNLTGSTEGLARWRLRLSEYDLDVVHRAGERHKAAGAPSRLRTTGKNDTLLQKSLFLLLIVAESDDNSILVINADCDDSILLNAQEEKSINTSPPLEKLVVAQALDRYCKAATLNFGHIGSELHIDQRELFIRIFIANESIQIVAPTSPRACILYLARHLPF